MTGSTDGGLVSAAEVARRAGATRAAVSHRRRRHPDFPEPVGGGRRALFALSEITGRLDRQRKSTDVSDEVLPGQEPRLDVRVPQMDLDGQRRHGAAFRALDEAQELLRELGTRGLDAIARARDGLTSGPLRP